MKTRPTICPICRVRKHRCAWQGVQPWLKRISWWWCERCNYVFYQVILVRSKERLQ